jgi:diguanylate cyclase (GGDEF)-like protein
MKKKYLIYLILFVFALFTLFHIMMHYNENPIPTFYAESGVLSLINWKSDQEKLVELNGDWRFYKNTLASDWKKSDKPEIKEVPHFWEEDKDLNKSPYGYATYVLEIQGLEANESYGIDVTDTVTAYTLYVNDKKIVSNGTVGISKATSVPHWEQQTGVFQADDQGKAELVMEISNFDYYRGGMWNTPVIGHVGDVLEHVQSQKVGETFLFAVMISFALFNFGIFVIYRKNKATFYFGCACLATAAQTVMTSQRIINYILPVYNWEVMVRLEYLSGYLMLPFFVLFIAELILTKSDKKWLKRIIQIYIAACCIVVVVPGHLYSYVMEPYKWLSFLMALAFLYIVVRAIQENPNELAVMIFAIVVIMLAILRDTLVGGTLSWVPFAMLVFIACFGYITFKQFLQMVWEKEELEARIVIDSLTGLYNRNYLKTVDIDKIIKASHRKTFVLFLDLDNFKIINDTYGHKLGDFILREVAKRFRNDFGAFDILCRYGGDEFIAVAFAENQEAMEELANAIIKDICRPYERKGFNYYIGVSIGICPASAKYKVIDDYIKASDEVMYEAKRDGKNRYVVRQEEQ